jgi:uncharacterized membrane protein YfcA
MLSHPVFSIVLGAVLGFLTGLGTGGGSLLLLWLTLALGMEPATARTVNLMFFIPAAIISSVLRLIKGGICFRKIILPALAGCISAAAFALAGSYMETTYLKKAFGILLIFTGFRELLYKPQRFRKPR